MPTDAITEFVAKQNALYDRQDAAITALTAKITLLQNNPPLLPEDVSALATVQGRTQSVTDKLETAAGPKPPTP